VTIDGLEPRLDAQELCSVLHAGGGEPAAPAGGPDVASVTGKVSARASEARGAPIQA
jgi:hypothetical protein